MNRTELAASRATWYSWAVTVLVHNKGITATIPGIAADDLLVVLRTLVDPVLDVRQVGLAQCAPYRHA